MNLKHIINTIILSHILTISIQAQQSGIILENLNSDIHTKLIVKYYSSTNDISVEVISPIEILSMTISNINNPNYKTIASKISLEPNDVRFFNLNNFINNNNPSIYIIRIDINSRKESPYVFKLVI